MNATEYCLDPDANFIFDEESLQAAIDMYNDRVVSQKHMVGRILIEQLLLIDKSYFEKKNFCRFIENPITIYLDV